MSALKGTVGKLAVEWKKAPHGKTGEGEVTVDGRTYAVRWNQDADGLWVEFAHGVFGYDIAGDADDADASTLVYRVSERGADALAYGLRFRGDGETALSDAGSGRKKKIRVRAQMPGKIVRVLAKAGDTVTKDQPLLVMEAMKMENEIRAAQAGKIETVRVAEGQAVESGADLLLIDSE